MRVKHSLLLVACAGLALGACEGVRNQFSMGKQPPDEFRVVSRAPLSLPPDFDLRPPEPGAPRPQEGTPEDQAREAVFSVGEQNQSASGFSFQGNQSQSQPGSLSSGEAAFLKAAGAQSTDSDIRATINQETARINEESEDFVDSLVFWREDEPPGKIVDADAESRRIRENQALGKDVDEGDTPVIERRKKAPLEDLF